LCVLSVLFVGYLKERYLKAFFGLKTIMAIAGHVSRLMLTHYAHIRTEAKRRALESIATKSGKANAGPAPMLQKARRNAKGRPRAALVCIRVLIG
jgi:hypothetical protein